MHRAVRASPAHTPGAVPAHGAEEPEQRGRLRTIGPVQRIGGPAPAGDSSPGPLADHPPSAPDIRTLQALALRTFEVLEGVRSVAQLGPWITLEVAEQLRMRRSLINERRTLTKDTRLLVTFPGPVHCCVLAPDTFEAAIILHTSHRSIAVAMRFEIVAGRWRATDLTVL